MVNEPTAPTSRGRSRWRGQVQPVSDGRASVEGGRASRGGRPVDRRSGCGEGGSDAAAGRGRVLRRPSRTVPGSVRRQPAGRESRWGVAPVTRSPGMRMARPTGRCVRGARAGASMCCRFRSLVDRHERCACRILENVALYSPGTGTYAPIDNVVKSDPRSLHRVRSHGNSPISGLLPMVAVSRWWIRPAKFANRFGVGSVAHDSSSGACAPPHRTAATAHLRTRTPRRWATWSAVREPNHGGS